jgi:hypothetical protein
MAFLDGPFWTILQPTDKKIILLSSLLYAIAIAVQSFKCFAQQIIIYCHFGIGGVLCVCLMFAYQAYEIYDTMMLRRNGQIIEAVILAKMPLPIGLEDSSCFTNVGQWSGPARLIEYEGSFITSFSHTKTKNRSASDEMGLQ